MNAVESSFAPARPRVAVVIVNWNRKDETLGCLEALLASGDAPWRIVNVDNGSEDGSVEAIRARFPAVVVIEAGRNLGFAAGNNLALRSLASDPPEYVWLLNNDARPSAGALDALVATAEAERSIAAVGSVLVTPGGEIEAWGGGAIDFRIGLPRFRHSAHDRLRLDYLVGASLLLRWTALAAAGFFDERYFLYWEDADLCFRLRAAGGRLAVADAALVQHRGQASSGFQSPTWDRELTAASVLFFRSHAPWAPLPIAVGTGGRLLQRALMGRWANVRATWHGLRRALAKSTPSR